MNPVRANSGRTRMAPASENRFSVKDLLTFTDIWKGQGNTKKGLYSALHSLCIDAQETERLNADLDPSQYHDNQILANDL